MNNVVVLPIVLPVLAGIVMILFRHRMMFQRALGIVSLVLGLAVSALLVSQISVNGIQTLHLGGWVPPFGIVLVADMFAALLVLTVFVVGIACLWFSFRSIGEQREKYFFHPIYQFLIAGVAGSFLTGDIFNLFVFFEVMLIASYVLIVLGGTKVQLRESIKYVLFNMVSSALFVVAVAFLYSVTGTLNMAHLAETIAQAGQSGIVTVISLLFLVVFGMKAGLFLYVWLPGAYSAPPPAVAAVFAGLLTKVGIYALIRVFSLIFVHEPNVTHQLIGWLAALTMILGVIGAVAYNDVQKVLVYNVISAVGFVVFGLAVSSTAAFEGTVYYLMHDMIVKGLLFLAGGVIVMMAGTSRLQDMGGLMKASPAIGWIFFLAALAVAGIPPLSGFIGKLLIVQGGLASGNSAYYWISGIGLGTSLLLLYSLVKVFMHAFWKEHQPDRSKPAVREDSAQGRVAVKGLIAPCAFLLAISVLVGLGAEWIAPFVSDAAETLVDPSIYIHAVLKE